MKLNPPGTYVQQYQPTDPRLGRHVTHDPRSLDYAYGALPMSAIKDVDWTRRINILDQGQVGSCTGNALAGVIGTDSATRTAKATVTISAKGAANSHGLFQAGEVSIDETFAVNLYKLNTLLDGYPGDYVHGQDTGSDGLACGKTAVALDLADGYQHAFTYQSLLSAMQKGSVLLGLPWMNSMFDTASDGQIKVDTTSGEAGGHELEACRYDASTDEVWVPNSWNESWGKDGWGYFRGADLKWLLSQRGDVTVVTIRDSAAPTPPPVPTPSVDGDVLAAARSLKKWADKNGVTL